MSAESSVVCGTSSSLDPRRVLVLHCSYCQLLTLSLPSLLEHLMTMHGDMAVECRVHQCTLCGATSTEAQLLREHSAIHHPQTHPSIKCISHTHINANLDADSTASRKQHSCLLCNFTAIDKDLLTQHYDRFHLVRNVGKQCTNAFNEVPASSAQPVQPLQSGRLEYLPAMSIAANSDSRARKRSSTTIHSGAARKNRLPSNLSTSTPHQKEIVIDLVDGDMDEPSQASSSSAANQVISSHSTMVNLQPPQLVWSTAPSDSSVVSTMASLPTLVKYPSPGKHTTEESLLAALVPPPAVEVVFPQSLSTRLPDMSASGDTDLPMRCSTCGNVYTKKRYFMEHVFCCSRRNGFQCPCGRLTKWRSNFYAHRKRCPVYMKFFSRKPRDHAQSASVEQPQNGERPHNSPTIMSVTSIANDWTTTMSVDSVAVDPSQS